MTNESDHDNWRNWLHFALTAAGVLLLVFKGAPLFNQAYGLPRAHTTGIIAGMAASVAYVMYMAYLAPAFGVDPMENGTSE